MISAQIQKITQLKLDGKYEGSMGQYRIVIMKFLDRLDHKSLQKNWLMVSVDSFFLYFACLSFALDFLFPFNSYLLYYKHLRKKEKAS